MKPQRLKRIVIKEELVALTGDFKLAVVLQQMIYWSERVKDFDKFIIEENERTKGKKKELTKGWIYKSGEELSEEVMLGLSGMTIRRYLEELIKEGYLSRRTNPLYKWDKTYQYRVNIIYINEKLNEIGYNLDGYPLHKLSVREKSLSDQELKVERAIPETTTETTTDKKVETSKKFDKASIEYKISEYLYSRILKNDPKYKKPNLQNWATHIDYLIRLDGRSPTEIKSVVNFVTTDDFEKVNVLSTRKLRERFGQLYIKTMNTKENKESSYSPREERNFV